jgi:ribosome-associated protein
MYEFKLENSEFVELSRLLKFVGLCESGGISKAEIAKGRVKVDGQVELRKRCKIRSGQIVEFQGNKILVS